MTRLALLLSLLFTACGDDSAPPVDAGLDAPVRDTNAGADTCVPACGGNECGLDPACGMMSCGECPTGVDCVMGTCDTGAECFSASDCPDPTQVCTSAGVCVTETVCDPLCEDGEECSDGECICVPSCAGRVCGDDGCGGSCSPGCDVGVCSAAGQCESDSRQVRVGDRCDSCDAIFESIGNCFQTGEPVISECGGASSGSPEEIPYCRRGAGDSTGYCSIRCASSCPSGFSCQDTGAGVDGCLR